jgi:hypothetical protein
MEKVLIKIAAPSGLLLLLTIFYLLFIIVRDVSRFEFATNLADHSQIFFVCIIFLATVLLKLKRTQMLLEYAKPNSFKTNLQGLSIAYIANLIIPFRLGEIARGIFISSKTRISLGFTFGTIILDRGVDIIVISTILIFYFLGNSFDSLMFVSFTDIIFLTSGTAAFALLVLVVIRTRFLLFSLSKISKMFNSSIESRIKNSIWGLILSFQQLKNEKNTARKYLALVAIYWILVFSSMYLLISSITGLGIIASGNFQHIPFISFVILNGNEILSEYASIVKTSNVMMNDVQGEFLEIFSLLSWIIYTLPFLIVGIVTLFSLLFSIYLHQNHRREKISLVESRTKALAPIEFLDSFFMRERIIDDFHKRSVLGGYKIIEYFKGGSDAVTMLLEKPTGKMVHKVSGLIGRDKLIAQELWLRQTPSKGIVKVSDSHSNQEF